MWVEEKIQRISRPGQQSGWMENINGEKNGTFMDPSPQNLHYFKVVYEKYHLSWIKRWYSTGVDKLWSVSQI